MALSQIIKQRICQKQKQKTEGAQFYGASSFRKFFAAGASSPAAIYCPITSTTSAVTVLNAEEAKAPPHEPLRSRQAIPFKRCGCHPSLQSGSLDPEFSTDLTHRPFLHMIASCNSTLTPAEFGSQAHLKLFSVSICLFAQNAAPAIPTRHSPFRSIHLFGQGAFSCNSLSFLLISKPFIQKTVIFHTLFHQLPNKSAYTQAIVLRKPLNHCLFPLGIDKFI